MIRRPPRSTQSRSSAASEVYKRQLATKGSEDWVTWDLSDIRMRPWGRDGRRLLSNLIYSGARVLDVFVEGEGIRRDGVTLTLDEGKASQDLESSVEDYYSEL